MRKVILENKKEEVYLSDLNEDSIVGVQTSICKFVMSRTKNGYEWIGEINLSSNEKSQYKTIKEACHGNSEVYQFDTMKELFKWLSED